MVWLNSHMVGVLDLWSKGHGFESHHGAAEYCSVIMCVRASIGLL